MRRLTLCLAFILPLLAVSKARACSSGLTPAQCQEEDSLWRSVQDAQANLHKIESQAVYERAEWESAQGRYEAANAKYKAFNDTYHLVPTQQSASDTAAAPTPAATTPAERTRRTTPGQTTGGCGTLSPPDCDQMRRLTSNIEDAKRQLAAAETAHDPSAVTAAVKRLNDGIFTLNQFGAQHLANGGAVLPDEYHKTMADGRAAIDRAAPAAQASSQLKNGDAPGALKTADKVIADHPNDPQAHQVKAEALERLGRHDEAAAEARRFAQLDPEAAKLLEGHGSALSRAESISSKARGLSFGEARDPGAGQGGGQPGGRPGYSQASMIGFGPTPAPPAPAGLAMTAPKSPSQLLVEKAWQKLRLGDKSGALLAATAAIDADPKNTWAWTIRAEIENEMGKFPPAEADATQAVSIDAANARAFRARAYAELEDGKVDAALADAQKAVELEPANGLGYLYRAMALEKLGRTAEALSDYKKAVALDPTLHALADDAIARLSGGAPGGRSGPALPAGALKKPLMRGGMIAGSLLLVLLGLLATPAGRALKTRATTRPPSRSDAETVMQLAQADLAPGMTLGGNYRLERELGRGGMGVVFEAVDQALQRRVAIKHLQADGDAARFLVEARLVAKLKHPNLAEIYNVIEDGGLYLVFEYVDGQGLDRALSLARKLPAESAARILDDVCAAVGYAHGQGIIHRDLKPSNVMIGRDGKAKVMDFGIAHQSRSGAALTRTTAAGTPPYMAPEQALGSTSKASDLYALAVMAYEMLTGTRPFDGPDYLEQKLHKQFQPPSRREPSLRPALDAFFAGALEPDPTRRPADAARFADAFREAAASG